MNKRRRRFEKSRESSLTCVRGDVYNNILTMFVVYYEFQYAFKNINDVRNKCNVLFQFKHCILCDIPSINSRTFAGMRAGGVGRAVASPADCVLFEIHKYCEY